MCWVLFGGLIWNLKSEAAALCKYSESDVALGQFSSCIICLVWSFKSAKFCHYVQRKWLNSFQFLFKRFSISILRANTEELCSKGSVQILKKKKSSLNEDRMMTVDMMKIIRRIEYFIHSFPKIFNQSCLSEFCSFKPCKHSHLYYRRSCPCVNTADVFTHLLVILFIVIFTPSLNGT